MWVVRSFRDNCPRNTQEVVNHFLCVITTDKARLTPYTGRIFCFPWSIKDITWGSANQFTCISVVCKNQKEWGTSPGYRSANIVMQPLRESSVRAFFGPSGKSLICAFISTTFWPCNPMNLCLTAVHLVQCMAVQCITQVISWTGDRNGFDCN